MTLSMVSMMIILLLLMLLVMLRVLSAGVVHIGTKNESVNDARGLKMSLLYTTKEGSFEMQRHDCNVIKHGAHLLQ